LRRTLRDTVGVYGKYPYYFSPSRLIISRVIMLFWYLLVEIQESNMAETNFAEIENTNPARGSMTVMM